MIHHVAIQMRPELRSATLAFYSRLGYHEVAAPSPLADRVVWLEDTGHSQIHLVEIESPDRNSWQPHFALPLGPSFTEIRRAFDKQYHPAQEYWASSRGFITDPSGNKIEIIERTPAGL